MKRLALFLLLFLYNISCTSFFFCQETDPLLVVILMVKDEEQVMQPTLQPFLDAGIDFYLVLDTGSTDETVSVTKNLFETFSVEHGCIVESPFVDFATSRNYAIEQAEQRFPGAKFILMIDAEWYIYNVENLLKFCRYHCNDSTPSFLVPMYANNEKNIYYQQRLFRAHQGIRFQGVVHESLNTVIYNKITEDVYFTWNPIQQSIEKSQARWLRDRDLLLKEQERNSQDPRTLFYLAQTFDCLGDVENASFWYRQRCEVGGWIQEKFMAHYRLACVYERMQDWDNAILEYLKAFSLRPTRIEPLVKLAEYYWNTQNYELCYMYAYFATKIELAADDSLFIEKEMYDYTRYDLLGRVAWYVGEYAIGKLAILKALQVYPDMLHLRQNLNCYLNVNL